MTTFPTRITESGAAVISPTGRITMVTAPQLRADLYALVDGGNTRVVVDFGAVEFIDSSGLSALISGLKHARLAGGDLRITAPNHQVTTILEATTLSRVVGIHETPEAAFPDHV
jgi:anti-sigma B factor antagonist